MPDPAFLNIADCARHFGVSRPMLYRLIRAGKVRAVRLGSRSMVDVTTARAHFDSLPDIRDKPARQRGAPGTCQPVRRVNGGKQ
ncbi:MAG TPA: helix-turn-helix domain-containing protein [Ktedonobacteraceae bacterium]|nr:helix-turn-helix domain-containing protein [Ktedonobacteraceae bacterium]